jgi:hypothetical protein
MLAELSAKQTYHNKKSVRDWLSLSINMPLAWVAMYANEPVVTEVMPCMCVLPDLVAFASSWSAEFSDVKMCL